MSGLASSRNRKRSRSPGRISRAPRASVSALWFTVPAVLALGFASGWLGASNAHDPWFAALHKPAFQPPAWAFPVAWTILYAMIGAAFGVILDARDQRRPAAATVFVIQLVLNLAWSPLFFRFHAVTAALVLIVAILAAAVVTMLRFWPIRPLAGLLMAPYVAWLVFAMTLNAAIVAMN